ncbi:MAG TPA: hypothetical protein VFA20_29920, partial [Myxococcaceae bacterium]|nr:hypothetical protein [Myxococcaceae bacterium]
MAIDISLFTLPCGVEAIKVIGEDEITREDATLLMSKVDPGGSLYRLPMLVLGQETRRLSLEARNLFSKPPPEGTVRPWCAVVVT